MNLITGHAHRGAQTVRMLTQMRMQLDELQRQLATGKRSDTYSGLGLNRSLDIQLRSQLGRADSFVTAIDTVGLRVNLMNSVLERMRALGHETRSELRAPLNYQLIGGDQTSEQISSALRFEEALSLLNERAGERYLFSGRATDVAATAAAKHIMDGSGARAGLRQLIAERLLADQGADGRGRLEAPDATGSVVTLTRDGDHPFGLTLGAVTTDFSATITPDAGPPPSIEIDLGGTNPPNGGRVQVRFGLPDGTTVDIELVATNENPPPANGFLIGADADATAQNLADALDTRMQQVVRVELAAASANQAGEEFFAIGDGNPPQRVAGPPFETATGFVDGTEGDTVFWYRGDAAAGNARQTSVARVDDAITVAYGARANEDGLRQIVQGAAVFAAIAFSDSDPDARDRYYALAGRLGAMLDQPDGVQNVAAIQTELAGAKLGAGAARERLNDRLPVLHGLLEDIENVSVEEVGATLLALNTRLQATLQTTAMLQRFSLLDYI
jgi:flagellin-like hook-associated protein FlgL